MIGFGRFFSKSSEHPLAKDEQVTTLIAALPTGDPVETLQDVTHWLMHLSSEEKAKSRPAKLFRIDQAAQSAERKLRQQHIEASRLHKSIEDRIWNAAFEFLEATVNAHLRCILEYRAEKRARGDAELAAMAVRAMRRQDLQAHWIHLRYQPLPESFWERVYALIKMAEEDEILRASPSRAVSPRARSRWAGGAVHKLVTGLKQMEQGAMPSILALSDASSHRRADLLEVLARLAQGWGSARPVTEHQHFDKRLFERKPFFIHICVTHGFNMLHAKLLGAKPSNRRRSTCARRIHN